MIVREALYQVASLLHDNPSRFQHSLLSSPSTLMHQPLISSHRNHAAARRDLADATEFCVCFICPAENVGGVIGKGGGFINQIRQETGATIRVTTSESEEDDSIIFISSKEVTKISLHISHTNISLLTFCCVCIVLRRSITNGECSHVFTRAMQ